VPARGYRADKAERIGVSQSGSRKIAEPTALQSYRRGGSNNRLPDVGVDEGGLYVRRSCAPRELDSKRRLTGVDSTEQQNNARIREQALKDLVRSHV
jgi:hypothetical protein